MAELCGNQPYIAECSVFLCFVADFHRVKVASDMHGKSFQIAGEEDLLMVAATDIGLCMQNALTALLNRLVTGRFVLEACDEILRQQLNF